MCSSDLIIIPIMSWGACVITVLHDPCATPPPPSPAPGLESLRSAVEAYADSQNLAAVVRVKDISGVASTIGLEAGLRDLADPQAVVPLLTGLHADVADELAGGDGLSVDVDLHWRYPGRDEGDKRLLTATLTGAILN